MSTAERDDAASRFTAHLETLGLTRDGFVPNEDGTLPADPVRLGSGEVAAISLPHLVIATSAGGEGELELGELLGVGGMGKVLLARQRALERTVAVKFLKIPGAGTRAAAVLLREALVTGRLEHPSIVPVYLLAKTADGEPFFAMKHVEGMPWSEALADPSQLAKVGRRAEEPLVSHLEILLQVCDAVAFAHSKGVLHRDLKPNNVMLGAFGEVYLLDWGIAVSLEPDRHLPLARDERGIAGTPAYMAPEMAAGDGAKLSAATDVYLLGAVLHELATGRPPHQGTTIFYQLAEAFTAAPPKFTDAVPAELAALCTRALARAPEDRFPSVEALRSAVADFLRHRDALRLAGEAAQRLATLERDVISARAAETFDGPALQARFSECRFGFEQAVRIWPGFEAAKDGLARAIEVMVEVEVLRDDARAARALLVQLAAPPPTLSAAVEALERRTAARATRVAALERFEADADIDIGALVKGRFAFVFALAWAAASLVIDFKVRAGALQFGYAEALGALCVLAVMNVGLSEWLRRSPAYNLAQRRLLIANGVATVSYFVFWGIIIHAQVPFPVALTLLLFLFSVQWLVAAALFDWRCVMVGSAYALGTAGVLLAPSFGILIFGVSTLVGFAGLGFAWRRGGVRRLLER